MRSQRPKRRRFKLESLGGGAYLVTNAYDEPPALYVSKALFPMSGPQLGLADRTEKTKDKQSSDR